MSAAWESYPGAPDAGADVCAVSDIPERGALGVSVGDFPMLVMRRDAEVWAFVNACPHQYLPLNHKGGGLVSADGAKLMCSNHGAMFDIETGVGTGGLVDGCNLDPVPVHARDGRLFIGAG